MSADGGFAFASVPGPEELAKFPLNDLGNGKRFIRTVGGRFREDGSVDTTHCRVLWVRNRGWMAFNGRHWDMKAGEEYARRMAHQVAEALIAQGEHAAIKGKTWTDFVTRSGSSGSSGAMLAQAQAYLSVDLDEFDRDPLALNVRNGVLRFRPGAGGGKASVEFLARHAPDDRMTRMADADWQPDAAAPLFDGLLAFAQPDEANRDYLRAVFGYIATGSVKEQLFLILQGKGGDGKSTLVGAVREVLATYAYTAGIEMFLDSGLKRGGEASPELARLAGDTRMICTSEPPRGSKLASAQIKAFTGGAPIAARELRQGIFEFKPIGKVLLECNGRPQINDTDDGIWRRVRIVLFKHQVADADKDKDLPDKLKGEKSGILKWLADGVLDWLDHGLVSPPDVRSAIEDYRRGGNPFAEWVADCLVLDEAAKVRASDLYNSYKAFCEDNGHERPMVQATFGRALGDMQVLLAGKDSSGKKMRKGARLRDHRDVDLEGGAAPFDGGSASGGLGGETSRDIEDPGPDDDWQGS